MDSGGGDEWGHNPKTTWWRRRESNPRPKEVSPEATTCVSHRLLLSRRIPPMGGMNPAPASEISPGLRGAGASQPAFIDGRSRPDRRGRGNRDYLRFS